MWNLQRDYAALNILALHMKDVMMSWIGCRVIPHTPEAYQALDKKFKDLLHWRISSEYERLDFLLKRQKRKKEENIKYSKPPPRGQLYQQGTVNSVFDRSSEADYQANKNSVDE